MIRTLRFLMINGAEVLGGHVYWGFAFTLSKLLQHSSAVPGLRHSSQWLKGSHMQQRETDVAEWLRTLPPRQC